MKFKWIDAIETYDGSQLRPLHNYLKHGLLGDSVVSWRGPCRLSPESIVDGEDLRLGEKICGDDMVHFIVEVFEINLMGAVGFQRLLSAIAKDVLSSLAPVHSSLIRRSGDDLYFRDGKLSISVATCAPNSCLIHFAVNVTNAGTPVKTSSLTDLSIDLQKFSATLMEQFAKEWSSSKEASQKVRPL